MATSPSQRPGQPDVLTAHHRIKITLTAGAAKKANFEPFREKNLRQSHGEARKISRRYQKPFSPKKPRESFRANDCRPLAAYATNASSNPVPNRAGSMSRPCFHDMGTPEPSENGEGVQRPRQRQHRRPSRQPCSPPVTKPLERLSPRWFLRVTTSKYRNSQRAWEKATT